jgi:hypothetical protein
MLFLRGILALIIAGWQQTAAHGTFRELQQETCPTSGTVELPENSTVLTTSTGQLVVLTESYDDNLKISSATATAYICKCNAGGGDGFCTPAQTKKGTVYCAGFGCTDCSDPIPLVVGGGSSGVAPAINTVLNILPQVVCPTQNETEAEIRAEEIRHWAARQHLLAVPDYSENGKFAEATEGYGLVAELVAGFWVFYQVPEDNFDKVGNLKGAVGPPNSQNVDIYQLAAGNKGKCYCAITSEQKPAGCDCEWNGNLCTGKGCCMFAGNQNSYCAVETSVPQGVAAKAPLPGKGPGRPSVPGRPGGLRP